MAISLVNFSGGSQQGGPFTTVASAAQAVANGNSLVVGLRWSAQAVNDNAGNTYFPLPHLIGNSVSNLGEGFHFFYCNNCVGNPALVVTATLVSTSVALDNYTAMGVWNIAGGPLTLDSYGIGTGSGTTMTYAARYTKFDNTIACVLGMSTTNLSTNTVNAPLVQDGGTSIAGQQICGASHAIFTTKQIDQNLVSTTSVNGTWQIGGPVFGIGPQILTPKKRVQRMGAALYTGRLYASYMTLERLF